MFLYKGTAQIYKISNMFNTLSNLKLQNALEDKINKRIELNHWIVDTEQEYIFFYFVLLTYSLLPASIINLFLLN